MTHRSISTAALFPVLCAVLAFAAAPADAKPSPSGQYLHNVFYNQCLTDRGENLTVVLQPCSYGTDGYIVAAQRWNHVPSPKGGDYYFVQLVSGLGHSLEFVGGAYGTPLYAKAVPSGGPQTVFVVGGGSGTALLSGHCGPDSCFIDSPNIPMYLEPYQHSRPMQATIGMTDKLDNFTNDMVLWTQGPDAPPSCDDCGGGS
ncbi:hypothetical protein ACFXHA_00125 [Nocardia sp. NPDC059240]|uniref:hypothetical protein n=1 Tax=Nocardia sp. NPDC059240 TaxID=3346786 RepID=UPI0036A8B846